MYVSVARIAQFAAFAALAGTGLVHGAQQATFHLPMAAHWGSVILQPGEYRMLMPDVALGERTLRIEGAGKTVRELPLVTDVKSESRNSYLALWQLHGEYFVREFSNGPAGKLFTFPVPRKGHSQQMTKIVSTNPAGTE